jgi:hypothetical protein
MAHHVLIGSPFLKPHALGVPINTTRELPDSWLLLVPGELTLGLFHTRLSFSANESPISPRCSDCFRIECGIEKSEGRTPTLLEAYSPASAKVVLYVSKSVIRRLYRKLLHSNLENVVRGFLRPHDRRNDELPEVLTDRDVSDTNHDMGVTPVLSANR